MGRAFIGEATKKTMETLEEPQRPTAQAREYDSMTTIHLGLQNMEL